MLQPHEYHSNTLQYTTTWYNTLLHTCWCVTGSCMASDTAGGNVSSKSQDGGIEHGPPSEPRSWEIIRREIHSTSRRNAVSISKELMEIARKQHRRRRRQERIQYILDMIYSQRCLSNCAEWYAAISACMTVVIFFMCAIVIAHVNTPSDIDFLKVPAFILCGVWLCSIGCMGVCAYAIEIEERHDSQPISQP